MTGSIALKRTGNYITDTLRHLGDFFHFTAKTFLLCFRPIRFRLVMAHANQLGMNALPLAFTTALFVGMVIVLQTGHELAMFNAKQYAAAGAAKGLTQVMIPVFTALVIGARTAASIAAELGTMRVTEQIDAMEVLDVNPMRYLVVPRLLAVMIMLPVMTVYADVVGLAGGWAMGVFALGVPANQYLQITLDFMTLGDVISGLIMTFFFAAAMAICGCYYGYTAGGGAEGVGRATTRAVVFTMMWLILLVYFLTSWILYLRGTIFAPRLLVG
ncbi:MAG: putative phospholipid ABC transporter permease protein MlaE [candidate division BRC1 bacterium ADurb.BinA292]|nr:MAG: putative phospholipid ABC transporter permease protein MlaE [candidate division BRC1 bacterium ADurb.BinA292]